MPVSWNKQIQLVLINPVYKYVEYTSFGYSVVISMERKSASCFPTVPISPNINNGMVVLLQDVGVDKSTIVYMQLGNN